MSPNDSLSRAAKLLERFPKSRPFLPPAYHEIYSAMYQNNRRGLDPASALALRLERWMHRGVLGDRGFPLLEIGAGTLNHVPLEPPTGQYDVIEPMADLYRGSQALDRLNTVYRDMAEVPPTNRYLRIISVAVLEHVADLPAVIARAAMLLRQDGQLLSGIPTEGGLAWYLAWRLGTGTTFRLRYGLSYAPFMRHEHINSAGEIESIIRLFFSRVEVSRFPTIFKHCSFYTLIKASRPNRDVAESYLARCEQR